MKYSYAFIFVFLASCKVGPDYHAPETPLPSSYTEVKQDKTFIPTDQELIAWWTRFEDPFLNSLLEESISGNFDYRIALEQVAQSRSQYWVEFTQLLPELDFDAQASRFRTSQSFGAKTPQSTTNTSTTSTSTPAIPPAVGVTTTTNTVTSTTTGVQLSPMQNFFQIGFDAIWEIDLFGKLRRAADSAQDTYEAFSEISQDVKITLLSEVANTYTAICSFQEKVALQTQIVDSDHIAYRLASDTFLAGLSSEQDVESARATLEVDRASLQSLTTELKKNIYSLSILLGKPPETVLESFLDKHPIPLVRGKVPSGIPADLLKQRHDIRAAERQLAAATEQVGVAVAQLYPSLSLSGSSSSFAANPLQGANYGLTSDKLNKLFKNQSRIWGIGGLLTVPVFDFGKRLAGIDVQLALQRQAALSYQKAVISALEEVEVALVAYFNEEEREKNLEATAAAYRRNYELTFDLFKAGLANTIEVAQAKNVWLTAASTHTDSQNALTSNLIAVYKSLGGAW